MSGRGEVTTGIRAVLSRPSVYIGFERLLGGHRARTRFVDEHLRLPAGTRLLDVGCGPGDLLEYLGDVEYVGLDLSAAYIEHARERFGDRGTFLVGDAGALPDDLGTFDVAVATGVLHHLDDTQAGRMLAGIASGLRPGGRFVGLEPATIEGQGWAARTIIGFDRGQHVRDPAGYERLARPAFASIATTVDETLLRIPYTHCAIECRVADGAPT